MSDQTEQPPHLTEEDIAYMIDTIQDATRGSTDAERLRIAADWEWMAHELRRVVALNGGAE